MVVSCRVRVDVRLMCDADVDVLMLQEQAHDAKQAAASPEDTDDLSPLPAQAAQPARRRGGISAEPVTEEDATSYVKKVTHLNSLSTLHFETNFFIPRRYISDEVTQAP